MEKWPLCEHGRPCVLKTGTRPGRNFGKHFFICGRRPDEQCSFTQPAKVPSMTCPVHCEMVTVRNALPDLTFQFRCKRGTPWCGVGDRVKGGKENIHAHPPRPSVAPGKSHESREDGSHAKPAVGLEDASRLGLQDAEHSKRPNDESSIIKSTIEQSMKSEDSEESEDREDREGSEDGEESEGEESNGEDREQSDEESGDKEESDGGDVTVGSGDVTGEGSSVVGDQGETWKSWRRGEGSSTGEEGEEEEVVVVKEEIGDPVEANQASLSASGEEEEEEEEKTDGEVTHTPEFKLGSQYRTLYRQLKQTEALLETMADRLPDGGERLRVQQAQIKKKISQIKRSPPPDLTRPGHTADDNRLFQKGMTFQARLLTSGVVEQLHSSLESCPGADTMAPQPPGVVVPLFPHQRRALAWLLWRERQTPSGGILADEMGLGKTLSMIALILQNPSNMSHHMDGLVTSRATLVVCAPSLLHQWEAEITSKLEPHTLSVLIYHGSRRTTIPRDLAAHDVVITTYDTVGSEGATALSNGTSGHRRRRVASCTTLFQVYWHRIILDEAHKIRNPKTAMAIGVSALKKVYRWAVTGTPVQNKLMDLYSLIHFLELAPFDDIREWKHSIERKSVVGIQRLKTMMAVLVLRRTKEDIAATHKLPEKLIQTHTVDLTPEEQAVYDALFSEARKVFVRFLAVHKHGESVEEREPVSSEDSPPSVPLPPDVRHCLDHVLQSFQGGHIRQGAVLLMLLRLRQCCCHPALMVTGVQGTDVGEGLEEALDALSLDHVTHPKMSSQLPAVFREQHLSTKICGVLREVRRIRALNPPEKCIVVSQWIQLLDFIRYQLDSVGISYTSIDSRVAPKQRSINVNTFNSSNPAVMLLSMLAGGEGLNLVGGNHVFMLDLHWNPAVELQATDRAHRVGQTRDVHVHRFVCRGTVEERIQLLQQRKLELSAAVLSGASRPKHGSQRLTLEDLKVLFQVQ